MSRHRTMRLLPAALAALALTLGGCGSSDEGDDTAADGARETPSATSGAAGPTTLTVDAAGAGRCMVPNAEALATQTTAFEGTVVELADGTATLEVEHWYAGDGSDRVTVTEPDHGLERQLQAVDFREGRTYLVSAVGDRVSLCGFTAEKTPELEALYAAAFGS